MKSLHGLDLAAWVEAAHNPVHAAAMGAHPAASEKAGHNGAIAMALTPEQQAAITKACRRHRVAPLHAFGSVVGAHDTAEALKRIAQYTTEGRTAFLASTLLQDGVIRNLIVIGEAVKNLSADLRDNETTTPWKSIAGGPGGDASDTVDLDLLVVEAPVVDRHQAMLRLRRILSVLLMPINLILTSRSLDGCRTPVPATVTFFAARTHGRVLFAGE